MADWKDILSGDAEQISEEELIRYLNNQVSGEEKDEIEKKINNDQFEKDALQGLLKVQNKDKLQNNVNQLNQKLYQITAKRQRKETRKIAIFHWIILALIILLFTCVISYIVISLHNKNASHKPTKSQQISAS